MDSIKLKSRIEKLEKNEYEFREIFRIIQKNNVKYSENSNGKFIDLDLCDQKCVNELKAFLDFIEENKKHIEIMESKIQENKITLDNNLNDRTSSGNFDAIICTDYSPFVTVDESVVEDEEVYDEDDFEMDTAVEQIEDLNELIDEDDDNIEEDITSASITIESSKKKKMQGIKLRILKKCKNINSSSGFEDELDIMEEISDQELRPEAEIV